MLTAISVILLMSFIIAFHELGHLFAARLAGVKVEKYSIGFGKKFFLLLIKKGLYGN
jgi:regulator of sigma E protease